MSTPVTMTYCPNEETLAAFVDGRMDSEARRKAIEHVTTCADCYSIVSAAWDYQAVAEPEEVAPVVKGRFGWLPIAASIAAGLIVVAFLPGVRERIMYERTGGVSALIVAQGEVPKRLVESRPAGGFPHKSLERVVRGDKEGPITKDEMWPLRLAGLRVEQDADARSWKDLRAAAIAQLLMGERGEAVNRMERAVALRGTEDAALLTDLAAVYLEHARFHRQAGDLARALQAAERAWQAAQTPENAWNRALAYEYSEHNADAIRAWNDYLKLDPSSPWAEEATRHIRDLQDSPL